MEQGAAGLWEEGSSAPGQPLSCSTPSALHQPLVITSSPSPRLQHKVNSTCEPQLCTEANCPLVILPYPAPWGVSAYPDSALFPSRKSQNKYWLQSKHDFPLHSWEQVNPPLTLVANPPITQDTRPKSSSAPQRHTWTTTWSEELWSNMGETDNQHGRKLSLRDAVSCSKPQSRGKIQGPSHELHCAGAVAWWGKGPAFLPPASAFQANLSPWVSLTPFLLREAGALYIGISHFADMQPCYEKGIFLFLEMRS